MQVRVKTDVEQQVWSECTRLIANSIILYNGIILSGLIENAEKTKDYEKIDLIKKISPVAWRHINLYGRYKFHKKENTIDIQKIIDILEEKYLT